MLRIVALTLAISGCTVLCPTVGVIRGSMNADVIVDEHGCEHAEDGTTRVPCTHPGPVSYPRTLAENLLAGVLLDAAFLVLLNEVDSPF